MIRNSIFIIMMIFSFVLQTSVFKWIIPTGIVPNLLIIMVASIGFMKGKYYGLFYGLLAGLMQDIFYGDIMGFYSLIYMYIGFANGFFERIFFTKDIKMPLIMFFISNLTYSIFVFVFKVLLTSNFNFLYYLTNIILPELIYTMLITMIVYPLILFVNHRLYVFEKGRRNKFV